MKTLIIIFCFLFLIDCSNGNAPDTRPQRLGDRPPAEDRSYEIATPSRDGIRVDATQDDFVGCWSSGNGLVMRIFDNQLLLSTNSFKPIRFQVERMEHGRLTIRLLNRPQFYFFQEIVSLEIKHSDDPFPLSITDYNSDAKFNDPDRTNRSGWMKFDCKEWFKDEK